VFAIPVTSVGAGYDLFQTELGTQFLGTPFEGVPLGTYNFGGMIGVKNVGNTDTIVQRLNSTSTSPVSLPSAGTPSVSLQVDALDLVSATPTNFGGALGAIPTGYYYLTLQSTDGTGPASTGAMTIDFVTTGGGTFTSLLDVFFDIHYGSLTGPIVYATDVPLSNAGAVWSRTAPANAVQINGVNNDLNGNSNATDFWVTAPGIVGTDGTTANEVVGEAQTPEPASIALFLAGGGLALRRRRQCA
jgi:hypothetical protein